MAAASSWESRDYSHLEEEHADDEEVYAEIPPSDIEGSQTFFDLLVELKMSGLLSARHVCVLSHWAKLGGLKGIGASLALAPTRTGGAFSAHFDNVLGMGDEMKRPWYEIKVPCHIRHDVSRSIVPTAALPAFEAVKNELAEDPQLLTKFAANFVEKDWAPSYVDHPLVREQGKDKVLPLGIYIDGVKYGYRDGTIGWWLINLATGRRS